MAFRDKHPNTRLSTVLLRLGLGAFLLFSGWQQTFRGPSTDAPNVASADAEGIQVDLAWPGVAGVGQMAIGGFLVVGMLTRLMVLPLIAASAVTIAQQSHWWAAACPTMATDVAEPVKACWLCDAAGQVAPGVGTAILLGTAALSLLFSGCGGVGLDRILFRRRSGSEGPPERLPPERLPRV